MLAITIVLAYSYKRLTNFGCWYHTIKAMLYTNNRVNHFRQKKQLKTAKISYDKIQVIHSVCNAYRDMRPGHEL